MNLMIMFGVYCWFVEEEFTYFDLEITLRIGQFDTGSQNGTEI